MTVRTSKSVRFCCKVLCTDYSALT